jgi:hypothetical protein
MFRVSHRNCHQHPRRKSGGKLSFLLIQELRNKRLVTVKTGQMSAVRRFRKLKRIILFLAAQTAEMEHQQGCIETK